MDRAFALQRDYIRLVECTSVMRHLAREYAYLKRDPPILSVTTSPGERRDAREQEEIRSAAGFRFERAADAKRHEALAAGARRMGDGLAAVDMDIVLDVERAHQRLQQQVIPFSAGPRETIAALAGRAATCDRQSPPR